MVLLCSLESFEIDLYRRREKGVSHLTTNATRPGAARRFGRLLGRKPRLYGYLVWTFLALYCVIDILTGYLLSPTPGAETPSTFLALLMFPAMVLAIVTACIGTKWVFGGRRRDVKTIWHRVIGTLMLFYSTFLALTFTYNPEGSAYPQPLIMLVLISVAARAL